MEQTRKPPITVSAMHSAISSGSPSMPPKTPFTFSAAMPSNVPKVNLKKYDSIQPETVV